MCHAVLPLGSQVDPASVVLGGDEAQRVQGRAACHSEWIALRSRPASCLRPSWPPQPCVTSQTPQLIGGSHTGQAAHELVSTYSCPESPISSRVGGKGVWVCPGGCRHPRSLGPGGGGNHEDRPLQRPPPAPFTPSATALVSADSDTQGWGSRAPGSPPLMTGAPVMTSPAPSLTPW